MALVRYAAQNSSSSNTTSSPCRYHVFLSFRGKDTRKNFSDHLYTALVNAGFRTFRDDDELERGEGINPGIERAIRQSRSSVIVFSKDFASSKWCLDELVMILERKRVSSDHIVLPVFYDVDPSQVRKQTGSFAKALAKHQKSESKNKVKEWREALNQVADLAGMVLQNQAYGYESRFINKIVQEIGDKVSSQRALSVGFKPVGIHFRVKNINSWLQDGSTEIGILVVYGMSGIGKTTIAKHVYNLNFRRFEGSSFIENIREISLQSNGLVQIQKQLLCDVLNGREVKIKNSSEGKIKIEDAISSKRVLLVLDDVDPTDQIVDVVLKMRDQFHPGSKIIMTTRRGRLSKAHEVTEAYNVETLNYNESLELFSWHAFRQKYPVEDYKEQSKKFVHHSGGLPLALQVLGSSLVGESIAVWGSALQKLEAIANNEIMRKLRVSYDLLDNHDQELFLNIACFFKGHDKDHIVRILDGCDFHTTIGIINLLDRCLVTIDGDNKVMMHDMIRDMGRGIVRLASEEPGKRNRLWHPKESFIVLREKNGTETIEGLELDLQRLLAVTPINPNDIVLETKAFARMNKLRLLRLSHLKLTGCYEEFPTGLRWLCWIAFPLDSIPIDFPLENLVVLEMQYSSLRQIWKGPKCLPNLKSLDLSHCHGITETTDFSACANLETLILVDCAGLIDVHESIGNLTRLVCLNMKDCRNLRNLPNKVSNLKLLEALVISGCTNLKQSSVQLMRSLESLKVLEMDGIPMKHMNEEVKVWPGRSSCIWSYLPYSLVSLSLQGCNLSDDVFSMDFGILSSLASLDLSENPIFSLPNCVKGLSSDGLSLSDCTRLKSLYGLRKLRSLSVGYRTSLEKTRMCSKVKLSLSPLRSSTGNDPNLVELQYRYKLEPLESVDTEVIKLLGLCNWQSMPTYIRMHRPHGDWQYYQTSIQGMYQYGIFSTFLPGNEVPGHFSHKCRQGSSSICFTVPLHPNSRIRGLNVFVVYANHNNIYPMLSRGDRFRYCRDFYITAPFLTKVSNKSKGLKWIYGPVCYGVPGWGEDMIWLSHWKLEDHLEGGDEVIVSVCVQHDEFQFDVKEWGIEVVQDEQGNISTGTQQKTTDAHVFGGDFSSYEMQKMPGTYWLLCYAPATIEKLAFGRSTLFNNLLTDSDEDKVGEQDEPEEQEEKDEHLMIAETRADSNNCGMSMWKTFTIIAGFIQYICSPMWHQRMSNNSSTKDSLDDDDSDITDMKLEVGGDGVEQDGNLSAATDTKRIRRCIGSASLQKNTEVRSVVMNVSNDQYLMQSLEILNKMEEIDDDSYSKALKLFHGDATWRKIFAAMPDRRRKNFILRL